MCVGVRVRGVVLSLRVGLVRTFLVFGGPPKFWRWCVWWVWLCGTCSGGFPSPFGFDHINRNAPVLIRTPKLTRFEPAQYWGGGPPGNSVVLNPLFFLVRPQVLQLTVRNAGTVFYTVKSIRPCGSMDRAPDF